jgi:hypothetical protein
MIFELSIALLAGAIINLLFSLNDIFGKPQFSWRIFYRQNLIPTLLNLVCGFVCIWFREELTSIYPITGLSAVFLGMQGQFFFKKLSKAFDKSIDTYIGI